MLTNVRMRNNLKGGIGQFLARSETGNDWVWYYLNFIPGKALLQNKNISSLT